MSLAVLLSAVATTQIGFVTLSRVSYAMGTDGLLPRRFGQLNPRYRTPAFGTILFAVITIAITCTSVYSSSVADAFGEIIATTGVLYGTFYAISAVTGTWYFRSQLGGGAGNVLLVAVLPLAAAAFLAWIIVKSVADFTQTENLTLLGVTRERRRDAGHRREEEISVLPALPRALQRGRLADRHVKPRRQRSDHPPGSSPSSARR